MTGRDHFRTRAKSSRCGPHHSGIVRGPVEAHSGKRFGITHDWNRLVSDRGRTPQMGAAEFAALLKGTRLLHHDVRRLQCRARPDPGMGGATRDPRRPQRRCGRLRRAHPVAETRNYVQRVMENLQVYRVRFGASTARSSPTCFAPPPSASSAEPVLVESHPTLTK
jgi:hypothetical protein